MFFFSAQEPFFPEIAGAAGLFGRDTVVGQLMGVDTRQEFRAAPDVEDALAQQRAQGPLLGGVNVGRGDEIGAQQVSEFLGVDAVVFVFAPALLVIGCAYAAIFGIWWFKRPRTAQTVDGRTVWLVEVGSDHLLPGEYLWYPAFWTLQHVFGYQPVGFAVETDRDVGYWARNPPADWLRTLHGQAE